MATKPQKEQQIIPENVASEYPLSGGEQNQPAVKQEQPRQTGMEQAPVVERPPEQHQTVEQEHIPETTTETLIDDDTSDIDSIIGSLTQKLRFKKKKAKKIPNYRDEVTLQIEKVMEEGLADAYKELTPIQKQEFKIKGEETAYQIRELLKKTHVKIKQIFRLLLEWLRLLPGINKFYLEQEAKIKADKIMAIKKMKQ